MKTKHKELKPYEIEDTNVGRIELVSYPWIEDRKIFINARTTPGDPTTMKTFRITATVDRESIESIRRDPETFIEPKATYTFDEQS